MKQHMISMFVLATLFLFSANGCGATHMTVTAPTQLAALENNSNANIVVNDSNFDLHIFTNDEEALAVPCYYWTLIDTKK